MFRKRTVVPFLSGSGFEASVARRLASLCSQDSLWDIMRGLAVGSDFDVCRGLHRAKFEQLFDLGL